MLRNIRSRRRSRHGAFLLAVVSTLILLFFLFHTQSSQNNHHHLHHPRVLRNTRPFHHDVNYDSLLSDSVIDDAFAGGGEDTIDALDVLDDQPPPEDAFDDDDDVGADPHFDPIRVSGFFFYHIGGVIRRAFNKRSLDEWDRGPHQVGIFSGSSLVGSDEEDLWDKATFGSDDVPVDESVRSKVVEVKGVEDALLLKVGRKVSPLREGWGDWFDKKSDFLRKEKMLRSSWEGLNPSHNPILQDPDGVGITWLTKGDKILQRAMMNEFKKVPFHGRKILEINLQGSSRHG